MGTLRAAAHLLLIAVGSVRRAPGQIKIFRGCNSGEGLTGLVASEATGTVAGIGVGPGVVIFHGGGGMPDRGTIRRRLRAVLEASIVADRLRTVFTVGGGLICHWTFPAWR